MIDNCLICGRPTPPGHVIVRNRKASPVGRMCSSHTLLEVIMDPMERFDVEVTFAPIGSGRNE